MDALFLSPHLDDAAFSAGGTVARLGDEGHRCVVVTVFTKSVPNPTGFALRCQTNKGLPAEADYMAMRRDEDRAAMAILGVREFEHIALPEAPHRGYADVPDLFGGVHDDDRGMTDYVADAIGPWLGRGWDRVYFPACLGNHVDHLHVAAAVRRLRPAGEVLRWRDTPYVLRDPGPTPDVRVDVAATLERKIDACAAYATQLSTQFGAHDDLRRKLTELNYDGEGFLAGVGADGQG